MNLGGIRPTTVIRRAVASKPRVSHRTRVPGPIEGSGRSRGVKDQLFGVLPLSPKGKCSCQGSGRCHAIGLSSALPLRVISMGVTQLTATARPDRAEDNYIDSSGVLAISLHRRPSARIYTAICVQLNYNLSRRRPAEPGCMNIHDRPATGMLAHAASRAHGGRSSCGGTGFEAGTFRRIIASHDCGRGEAWLR